MSSTAVLSIIFFISLLCSCQMQDDCAKLTTMDTQGQSLQVKHRTSAINATLEMDPFLIRSENGNIAVTLSEYLNGGNNTRSYQIFIEDNAQDKTRIGCLQISDESKDQKGHTCKKQFVLSQDDVDFVMLFRIYSEGVIELKINNQTRFIYKDRKQAIDVKFITVASTQPDSYNEFYFNCFNVTTQTFKIF